MAKHVWSVLCYKGCLDQYTNQVSLLDVIEAITVKAGEPLPDIPDGKEVRLPVQMALVTLWVRSDPGNPETAKARLRTILPNGSSKDPQPIEVDLTKHMRLRNFVRIESLPFHGSGYFHFIFELYDEASDEWRTVAEVPLEFKFEPYVAPEATATASPEPAAR